MSPRVGRKHLGSALAARNVRVALSRHHLSRAEGKYPTAAEEKGTTEAREVRAKGITTKHRFGSIGLSCWLGNAGVGILKCSHSFACLCPETSSLWNVPTLPLPAVLSRLFPTAVVRAAQARFLEHPGANRRSHRMPKHTPAASNREGAHTQQEDQPNPLYVRVSVDGLRTCRSITRKSLEATVPGA